LSLTVLDAPRRASRQQGDCAGHSPGLLEARRDQASGKQGMPAGVFVGNPYTFTHFSGALQTNELYKRLYMYLLHVFIIIGAIAAFKSCSTEKLTDTIILVPCFP